MAPWLLLIEAVGVTALVTVTVIGAEVTDAGVEQLNEDVSRTLTWALLLKLLVVNVKKVWPGTSVPFNVHRYCGLIPPLVGVAVKVMF